MKGVLLAVARSYCSVRAIRRCTWQYPKKRNQRSCSFLGLSLHTGDGRLSTSGIVYIHTSICRFIYVSMYLDVYSPWDFTLSDSRASAGRRCTQGCESPLRKDPSTRANLIRLLLLCFTIGYLFNGRLLSLNISCALSRMVSWTQPMCMWTVCLR